MPLTILPWRVKAMLSRNFPLAYRLVVNVGTQGNSQEHWDRMLEQSWDEPSREWPTKVERIKALVAVEQRILDVACGTGSILRALRRDEYAHLHALEISAYAVDRLNAEGIVARRGALPKIAFADGEFDVVIASQVLEHIIRRHAFVREIRRVLRPGGRAFIFVPDNCLGPIDEPEHVIAYTASTLRQFLEKHFRTVHVESMRDANHESPILFAQAGT